MLSTAVTLALGAMTHMAWAVTNVDKCRTISTPGSYKLTKNLTAHGTCFFITASNVTLDLGGHTLTGNFTGAGMSSPDTSFDVSTVAIQVTNGAITNFGRGVSLRSTHGAVVTRLQVTSNVLGGIGVGPGGLVEQNTVSHNGQNGISAGAGSTINLNEIRHKRLVFAIEGLAAGWGSIVTRNTVSEDAGDGIVTFAWRSMVRDNIIQANDIGIEIHCPATITGNDARRNSIVGISTFGDGCFEQGNFE